MFTSLSLLHNVSLSLSLFLLLSSVKLFINLIAREEGSIHRASLQSMRIDIERNVTRSNVFMLNRLNVNPL